ncbi:unnamed protein product [Caenorhabditis brenneri]
MPEALGSDANNLSEALSDEASTPPKSLSDMPVDVVGLIIRRSDYKEQLILRKVSKSLRALVDIQKPSLTRFHIYGGKDHIQCCYNGRLAIYVSPDCKDLKILLNGRKERVIVRDDYEKIALDDIAFTLKNPNLQLDAFSADFNSQYANWSQHARFREMLESIGHQVSTRSCKIEVLQPSIYFSILPYLKPGVLEKIAVSYYNYADNGETVWDTFYQISLLDQWKQAKELNSMFLYDTFPLEYATHFKRFHFYTMGIDSRLLIRLRNNLATSNNFEYCRILTFFSFDAQYLCDLLGEPAAPNKRTEYVSHYQIPNSDDYLEFMFVIKDQHIHIEKKKKQQPS